MLSAFIFASVVIFARGLPSPTVPSVDECVSVNASTPIECPAHIGPPCPPCFTNDRPDYTKGDSLSLQDKTTQDMLSQRLAYWVNYWLEHYPPNSTYPLATTLQKKGSSSAILAQSRSKEKISYATEYGYGYDYDDNVFGGTLEGSSTQFNIFTGSAGRGQIFLRMYRYTKNETHLNIANEYINHALSLLPSTESTPSYLEGHIGVYAIKLLYEKTLSSSKQNQTAIDHYQDKILNVFESVGNYIIAFYNPSINNGSFDNARNNGKLPNIDYDMYVGGNDMGLGGLLYTGLFLNDYLGDEFVDKEYFYNISKYEIDLGVYNAINLYNNRDNKNTALYGFDESIDRVPLMYETSFLQGCYMYGMGHGNGGVMKWLLEVARNYYPELLQKNKEPKAYQYLTNTLDYFIKIQLEDGNMPTAVYGNCSNNYGTDDDARVQWCHGAPGYVF